MYVTVAAFLSIANGPQANPFSIGKHKVNHIAIFDRP
jgi:hypothetical protein